MIGNLERWSSDAVTRARERGLASRVSINVTRPNHPGGGYVVDFDGARIMGQFIVWPNGAVEASAVEIATEERIYFKSIVATETEALDHVFDDFVRALSDREPT